MAGRKTRQTGFVLLTALVLLALAGVVASAVARHSSALALRANSERQRLRRRWAMMSLQYTFGARIEDVLGQAETDAERPVSWCRRRIRISGADVELVFGDEQAKANVNCIHQRDGNAALSESLRRLLGPTHRRSAAALWAPRPAPAKDDEKTRPFRSFEQLLAVRDAAGLLEPFSGDAPPVSEITCWGDGRINFRRASPEALREIASGVLDPYQQARLLSLRQEIPGISLQEALRRLELTDRQLAQAERVLTDRSTCQSLWIALQGVDRRWYRLAIYGRSPAAREGQLMKTFTW